MKTPRIAAEGARALTGHKLRTFFMMAGTVAGIAALTVIMAVGKGTERKVMKRVAGFGPRAIMLIAGGGKDLPPPDLSVTTLELEDADAIREQVSGVEFVSPAAMKRQIPIKAGPAQTQATVFAVEPNWHDAWDWYVRDGEGIADQDLATMARVCVVGATLRRDLFGDADPIGEYVQIGAVRFRVKGILDRRGVSPMGTDFDNRVLIPLTTGLRRLFNQEHVTYIRIKVRDRRDLASITDDVRRVIHRRHHITPPREDDFRLVTPLVIGELVRGTSRTLSLLLMALAALSLLVGGVVLMNILLISVSERKREIGLRRAVGATRRDIMVQFLTESLAVTFVGMLAGCVLGVGVCLLLRRFTQVPVALSWEPVALGLAFALLVGTFFGVQPARKAARLNPVEGLR